MNLKEMFPNGILTITDTAAEYMNGARVVVARRPDYREGDANWTLTKEGEAIFNPVKEEAKPAIVPTATQPAKLGLPPRK